MTRAMFLTLVAAVVALSACGSPPRPAAVAQEDVKSNGERPDDYGEWVRTLNQALSHTEDDRRQIQLEAAKTTSAPVVELARVLLDEWHLPLNDATVVKPRPIVAPRATPDQLRELGAVKSTVVVLEGTVGSDGFVLNARVAMSSGNNAVDEAMLVKFKSMRFRPARMQDHYVPATYGAVINLSPI